MSTGKRLAKRSIIGTRVCAPADDGKFYSGVIQAVKSPAEGADPAETRYAVRFDANAQPTREYSDQQLIGPGFQTVVSGIRRLVAGQRVYLTYNGREVSGEVTSHDPRRDEVRVHIQPPGHELKTVAAAKSSRPDTANEAPLELRKRLDELRLLESRKSARLMDQDTDFARLADMAGDRKRPASAASNGPGGPGPNGPIDVPVVNGLLRTMPYDSVGFETLEPTRRSRKRRPSSSHEDVIVGKDLDFMDECTAALVLMSLSCSPHSPHLNGWSSERGRGLSPSPSSSDGSSWRSGTPSPPLSDASATSPAFWAALASDEGIGLDDDELPRKRKAGRVVFQCTWPGCSVITTTCSAIESHVRKAHLGARDAEVGDREEEFYYTEVQLGMHPTSSPPTLSHRDMARPPHEDPEYQRQLKQCQQRAGPINIPPRAFGWGSAASSPASPQKHLKLSPRSAASASVGHPSLSHHAHHFAPTLSLSAPNKLPGSPTRKLRGETKKCRKVYGMEHRELWCTQCKWKKACTRFGD